MLNSNTLALSDTERNTRPHENARQYNDTLHSARAMLVVYDVIK